ncbi:pyridoxal 5'-phosphate synthase glutaminase subunit PdxT [Peribacillus sp. SCS-155]|uniref:pyridoxal 5'-phosphate synthase glutaminase subunit PdxT n=1 Tax=Peribacillus sedimenti TaxID=3115297 RepID=UPI003905A1F6
MVKIGVLGLQGAVREHVRSIEASGAEAVVIKKIEQLNDVDGLVLPGGESTTMRKLIDQYGFMEPLQEFIAAGNPIFGTCAGLILLAKRIQGNDNAHLQALNVTVERNSFGRQRESFEAALNIKGFDEPFTGVFIRAPHIVEAGEGVDVLAEHNGRIVAVQEGSFLGCSFHPELTEDHRIMEYFVEMVKSSLAVKNG